MSHFVTLVNTYVDVNSIEEDPAFLAERTARCEALKAALEQKPDDFMLKFCLKETLHPANEFERTFTGNIDDLFAPFSEQSDDPEYTEFVDMTGECRRQYEEDTTIAVRLHNIFYTLNFGLRTRLPLYSFPRLP